MRNLWRSVVGVVLFSACGVMAYQTADRSPRCDAPPIRGTVGSDLDRADLARALAERDLEVARLRAELESKDDGALYEEALTLGIVDAVKASKLPPRQQRRVAVAILREARANNVDPLLVVAVIRTESSFNNYAVSHVGAMGLMQVMPGTGNWLVERRGEKLGRDSNLFDSELNIELGTAYLAELIRMFGAEDKALVAYNAGPANAKKILQKPDVRKKFMAGYPKKVLGEFKKLKASAETRMAGQVQAPVPDGRG